MKRRLIWIVPLILALLAFAGYDFVLTIANGKTRSGAPTKCFGNIKTLGSLVLWYADAHNGRVPIDGQNGAAGPTPLGLQALRGWLSPPYKGEFLDRRLKCPSDVSGESVSYEYVPGIAGKSLNTIPWQKWGSVPLLAEKEFPGNHCWVYYLDGHMAEVNDHAYQRERKHSRTIGTGTMNGKRNTGSRR